MTLERKIRSFGVALLLSLCSAYGLADEAQDEALAIADRALALITAEDFRGLADLMITDAIIVSNRMQEESYQVRVQTAAEQASAEVSADLIERGFDATVLVSGPIAMVWYPYDIYVDGAWSHCGIDIFSLVQTDEGWKIGSIVYSVEQPPACQPHPDGKPN